MAKIGAMTVIRPESVGYQDTGAVAAIQLYSPLGGVAGFALIGSDDAQKAVARLCEFNSVKDRVPIFIKEEARTALRDLLWTDEMRGVGYSDFIMRAVEAAKRGELT